MFTDALNLFKKSVDPKKTHLRRLPKIILLFGSGPIGVEEIHRNSSFRNVFLNWAHDNTSPLRDQFRLPEDYPEWNRFQGYQNLVDFESDAGALSGGILLFSEGSGALAELGAFCMDKVLSERLLVVIRRSHFSEDSFLVHGPLKKIASDHSDASICVIESETPEQFYSEASKVAEALQEKVNANPRKELVSFDRVRDQLLVIADLVELFGALTETETLNLLKFLGLEIEREIFRRLVGQLLLFNLLEQAQKYSQKYLIAPTKNRDSFIDYDSANIELRFDRINFKVKTFEYLKKESTRRQAYSLVHGEVTHGSN